MANALETMSAAGMRGRSNKMSHKMANAQGYYLSCGERKNLHCVLDFAKAQVKGASMVKRSVF